MINSQLRKYFPEWFWDVVWQWSEQSYWHCAVLLRALNCAVRQPLCWTVPQTTPSMEKMLSAAKLLLKAFPGFIVTVAVWEGGIISFGCWGLIQDLEDQEMKQQIHKCLVGFYAFNWIGKVRTSVLNQSVSGQAPNLPIQRTALPWNGKKIKINLPVLEKKGNQSEKASQREKIHLFYLILKTHIHGTMAKD